MAYTPRHLIQAAAPLAATARMVAIATRCTGGAAAPGRRVRPLRWSPLLLLQTCGVLALYMTRRVCLLAVLQVCAVVALQASRHLHLTLLAVLQMCAVVALHASRHLRLTLLTVLQMCAAVALQASRHLRLTLPQRACSTAALCTRHLLPTLLQTCAATRFCSGQALRRSRRGGQLIWCGRVGAGGDVGNVMRWTGRGGDGTGAELVVEQIIMVN